MLHLGRDYPGGFPYFRNKLKIAFMKNSTLKDQKEIESAISRGEFVIKELEGKKLFLFVLRTESITLCFYLQPSTCLESTVL
jgi:hypothetical protein